MSQKPWRQLAFVLGEAALSLVSGGVLFIIISRTSGPKAARRVRALHRVADAVSGREQLRIPEFIMRETGALAATPQDKWSMRWFWGWEIRGSRPSA